MTCDMETLKTEANIRIQSSAVQPDVKEICKNMKRCHSTQFFFVLKSTFHIKIIFC